MEGGAGGGKVGDSEVEGGGARTPWRGKDERGAPDSGVEEVGGEGVVGAERKVVRKREEPEVKSRDRSGKR